MAWWCGSTACPVLVLLAAGGCSTGGGGGGNGRPNTNAPANVNRNDNSGGNANSPENANANDNVNAPGNANGGDPLEAPFGEPIPGLTGAQLGEFTTGRAVFERSFKRIDGLGPLFNATSCRACHEQPAGGGSARRYRNVYLTARTNLDGTLSPINITFVQPAYGPLQRGPFLSFTVDERRPIPADADVVAQRNPPALFGIGQFENVSDATILALEDPDDSNGDGISGRANRIDGAVGRYGAKAQVATLLDATRGLLLDQMGITTDAPVSGVSSNGAGSRSWWRRVVDFLDEFSWASPAHAQIIVPPPEGNDDTIPDPELTPADLQALVAYQRYLAMPPRGLIDSFVERGEQTFTDIGCAACHVRDLPREDGVMLTAWTDLLLHDMGAELADGVVQGLAGGGEFRTAPLWGVTFTAPFLHDGRADTLEEAILLHGGEAAAARDRFAALDEAARVDLMAFLNSL